MCWKPCPAQDLTFNYLDATGKVVEKGTRKYAFERDAFGTCWETCIDPATNKPYPNCVNSALRVSTDGKPPSWKIWELAGKF